MKSSPAWLKRVWMGSNVFTPNIPRLSRSITWKSPTVSSCWLPVVRIAMGLAKANHSSGRSSFLISMWRGLRNEPVSGKLRWQSPRVRNFYQSMVSKSPTFIDYCPLPGMTSLFSKFKSGLQKTQSKLAHEIKRIVSRSPRLDATALEELEAALLSADLGMEMTSQIVNAVKANFETQGREGSDVFSIAVREIENGLSNNHPDLRRAPSGPTVVSMVGVRS